MKYILLFLISFQAFAHNTDSDFRDHDHLNDHEHVYTPAIKKIVAEHVIKYYKIKHAMLKPERAQVTRPFEWIHHEYYVRKFYDPRWPVLSRDKKTKKLIPTDTTKRKQKGCEDLSHKITYEPCKGCQSHIHTIPKPAIKLWIKTYNKLLAEVKKESKKENIPVHYKPMDPNMSEEEFLSFALNSEYIDYIRKIRLESHIEDRIKLKEFYDKKRTFL